MKANFIPAKIIAPAIGISRFALYTLESLPIILLRRGIGVGSKPSPPPPENNRKVLFSSVMELIQRDIANLEAGVYPKELLLPEPALRHVVRYSKLIVDSIQSAFRAKYRQHKYFTDDVENELSQLPEYYKRNFHFQTNGYLSEESAELYGHQTEILFAGTLDLMRRVLLAPVIQHINSLERPQVLELACGVGESTQIILKSCPQAEITAVDFSNAYIKKAKASIDNPQVSFQVGDATQYSDDKLYDVVFATFVLHELPAEERIQLLKVAHSKLKPGGLLAMIDSLQLGDNPAHDWALIQFPKDFHEPFYANYVNVPLDQLVSNTGLRDVKTDLAFLAKSVMGLK